MYAAAIVGASLIPVGFAAIFVWMWRDLKRHERNELLRAKHHKELDEAYQRHKKKLKDRGENHPIPARPVKTQAPSRTGVIRVASSQSTDS